MGGGGTQGRRCFAVEKTGWTLDNLRAEGLPAHILEASIPLAVDRVKSISTLCGEREEMILDDGSR
ncbi:hypothetical protein CU102_04935 [Phyllobacterium brassicacearum]|uniref:Uncharacterized protein n=1 Tax=Phyllobacterium brassicacearum TaxID=314235 RepID=A0A2P7BVD3_9HYPH|nr:hypothetical protein CU102_04935 [Phyllobacterium brassicacearum]